MNLLVSRRLQDTTIYTACCALALVLAFQLRFDFAVPPNAVELLQWAIAAGLITKAPVFYYAGLHRNVKRFAGLREAMQLAAVNAAASAVFACAAIAWSAGSFPRSVLVMDLPLCFLLTALPYFWERIRTESLRHPRHTGHRKRILIYGAGVAGTTLLREIRSSDSIEYEVAGFLDDDASKRGAFIMGVPVLGEGRNAAAIVDRFRKRGLAPQEIVIAMPSASSSQMREAVANVRSTHVPCKTIPGVRELLNGKVLSAQLREPAIQDLLGRRPVHLDEEPIHMSVAGHSVLVTGAAGSIGSELCRQLARFGPATLVALDQAESELFKVDHELRERFPDVDVVAAVGDIRDPGRLNEVVREYSVNSVFHAAAYKHVPLMERDVLEAVRNNILGTWNLVRTVRENRVPSLVMISSDKAVNPRSVMGATKRVCELIISAMPESRTGSARAVSVRFGNVLGSNGSVVPLFQRQIAAGGPVKITHPDMQRYFMTVSEAVSLVLQASTMGRGGEIFVLDMGEPVRIVDLAVTMIRLAGLDPYKDIDIHFTGLRPGEKLVEEINGLAEKMLPTYHEKIKIFQDPPPDWQAITEWIGQLKMLLAGRRVPAVLAHVRKLVPEYLPGDLTGAGAEKDPTRTLGMRLAPSRRPVPV